ncbi:lipid II:glycine glycyltransferase FemX [Actinobaculum suis]|uniref:lipid II:glycine glycyltransferase FemX n=1 Tax=Actinobaculum suis TaxID=1657 RepID=UPI00080867A3|nr:peptidoglycan bridge formation glycyltransferase FemA/FemB family protein [Actinobaculum suis]OCA93278.1 hypothetical protein ACU20_01825 [Actinobaculum suis]OCA94432.1 hypothetical protein ACU21_06900 [Actinobaculum suis]
MFEFVSLSEEAYANAVTSQVSRGSYRFLLPQLPEYGQVMSRHDEKQIEYLAVRERGSAESANPATGAHGEIVATALVYYQPWRKLFRRAIITYGPVLDWDNEPLVRFLFTELEKYLSVRKNVVSLRINPPVAKAYYQDIEKTAESEQGQAVHNFLTSQGFVRTTKEFYDQPDIPIRYLYTKDIAGKSFPEVADTLRGTMRRQVKHRGRYGVEVEFSGAENWDVFHKLYEASRERTDMEELSGSSAQMYRDLLATMGPQKAFIGLAYANPEEYLAQLQADSQDLETRIAKLEEPPATGKKTRALKELRNQQQASTRRIAQISQLLNTYGPGRIAFAGALAFRCGDELVQLLRGFNKDFGLFNRDYPLESALLRWACENQIRIYNTFGVSGIFDDSAPDAAVLEYKRNLHGNIEEFIGTYTLELSTLASPLGALE